MWTLLLLAALKTAPQRRTTSKDVRLDRGFVQHATNMLCRVGCKRIVLTYWGMGGISSRSR